MLVASIYFVQNQMVMNISKNGHDYFIEGLSLRIYLPF